MFLGIACGLFVAAVFLEHPFGDYVALGGPGSQVNMAAAVAAEREIGVHGGIGGFAADRTKMLHGSGLSPGVGCTYSPQKLESGLYLQPTENTVRFRRVPAAARRWKLFAPAPIRQ